MDIRVRYFEGMENNKLEAIAKGDWIDVRVNKVEINGEVVEWHRDVVDGKEYVFYNGGDVVKVYLGFAMELPKNKEAMLCPRSSTFKNYGFIQTNSFGVIDNSFKGDGDEWAMMLYALKGGTISRFDRVGQFRLFDRMGDINFKVVERLGNEDRGGFGSTGVK